MPTEKWTRAVAAYSPENSGKTFNYNAWRDGRLGEVVESALREQRELLSEASRVSNRDTRELMSGMEHMAASLRDLSLTQKIFFQMI